MRKFILIVLAFFLGGVGFAIYLLNRPPKGVERTAYASMSSIELYGQFESDESKASAQYLDRTLEVFGVVSSITINQDSSQVVVLESSDPVFGVSCTQSSPLPGLKPGDSLRVRGICRGFLSDVVLTDCIRVPGKD